MPPLSPTPPPPHLGRRQLLASAISALLSACGGGGADGGAPTAGVSTGGTGSVGGGKPAAVSGRVSAQGLRVNDVGIDIDSHTVITDEQGQSLSAAALQPGTTVVVDGGTVTGGSGNLRTLARRIQVRSLIVGPVQTIGTNTLQVMDHTVVIGSDTALDASWAQGLASLSANTVIEVYGWHDVAQQRIVATRLAAVPRIGDFKVTGTLADLDLNAGACRVSTQLIAYGWPNAASDLQDGQWVQGSLYAADKNANNNRWLAIQMDRPADWLITQDQISLEGLLTSVGTGVGASGQLGLQGWRIDARQATCTGCGTLRPGQAVRVIGRVEAGTVIASAIYPL